MNFSVRYIFGYVVKFDPRQYTGLENDFDGWMFFLLRVFMAWTYLKRDKKGTNYYDIYKTHI